MATMDQFDDPKPQPTGRTCQQKRSPEGSTNAAAGDFDSLMTQMAQMLLQAKGMKQTHTEDLKQRDDTIMRLESEIENLTESCRLSEATVSSLTGEKEDLLDVVSKVKQEIKKLEAEVSELRKLRKEYDGLNKRMAYLTARHDATTQKLHEREKQLETLNRSNETLSEALQKNVKKIESYEKIVAELNATIHSSEMQVKTMTQQLNEERERVEVVMREKQELCDSVKDQQKKNEVLHVKMLCERELLQYEIQELQRRLREGNQKIADLEEENMQSLQQFQGLAKFATGIQDLMEQHKPLDIVKAASGEGNSLDDDVTQEHQVVLESIESENLPTEHTSSSFQELPRLPANLPDVSMDILVFFAEQMGGKWDSIAYALGVGQLAALLAQSHQLADSKCLTVLQTWIEQGPEVTWQILLDALWKLGLRSCALAICKKLNDTAIICIEIVHACL